MRLHGLVFGVTLTAACGGDAQQASVPADVSPVAPDSASADTAVPAPLDVVAEADVGSATDAPEPVEVAAPPDVSPPAPEEVRFVVIGDAGTGSSRQRKVAVALRDACAARGCDFVLMTGDNIYEAGASDTLDAQWETKFESPYRDVPGPFYPALGNHDNGGFLTQWLGDFFGGAGAEFERGDVQVAYSQVSDKWRMPARSHDFREKHAHFFALDTNDMIWASQNDGAAARTAVQVATFPSRIDASDATWKIAFGHHPWISNGRHGDAGTYEGLEEEITDLGAAVSFLGDLSDVVSGDGVRDGLEAIVCDRVDLYFAGHDHSLQWFMPQSDCPKTHFVVSGAGAKLTRLDRTDRTRFQHVSSAGFFWVSLRGPELRVAAIDEDGVLLWEWQTRKE
jgi:tartrate-resistant acid phosphatase type 5